MSIADPAATILLVEDDGPTRTFLADNLTADGYELLVADCARDGLRLLETKFPDVALVDLGLPDGSGLEIVRRVRASDGVASRIDPAVVLVVVSGRGGELDRLRGFERGCDDYVCKAIGSSRGRRRATRWLRAIADVGLDSLRPAPMSSPTAWLAVGGRCARRRRERPDRLDDGAGVVFVVGLRMAPARRAGEQ
jgi:DNA-binding response OmpR family regulator